MIHDKDGKSSTLFIPQGTYNFDSNKSLTVIPILFRTYFVQESK